MKLLRNLAEKFASLIFQNKKKNEEEEKRMREERNERVITRIIEALRSDFQKNRIHTLSCKKELFSSSEFVSLCCKVHIAKDFATYAAITPVETEDTKAYLLHGVVDMQNKKGYYQKLIAQKQDGRYRILNEIYLRSRLLQLAEKKRHFQK